MTLPSNYPATSSSVDTPRTPRSTLFPYTTLFRSDVGHAPVGGIVDVVAPQVAHAPVHGVEHRVLPRITHAVLVADRKSTRLNSSHPSISYAVFCLKKKSVPAETAAKKVACDAHVV